LNEGSSLSLDHHQCCCYLPIAVRWPAMDFTVDDLHQGSGEAKAKVPRGGSGSGKGNGGGRGKRMSVDKPDMAVAAEGEASGSGEASTLTRRQQLDKLVVLESKLSMAHSEQLRLLSSISLTTIIIKNLPDISVAMKAAGRKCAEALQQNKDAGEPSAWAFRALLLWLISNLPSLAPTLSPCCDSSPDLCAGAWHECQEMEGGCVSLSY